VTTGTVLLLPAQDPGHVVRRAALAAAGFTALSIEPVPGPEAAIAARTCAAIHASSPTGPLHIVAFGSGAMLLPAIALAQRAARRLVAEYVLVDAEVPPVTDAWPDARVVVYGQETSSAAASGRLRGWDVLPLADVSGWTPSGQ
jgi:thioesterase domain-containing protein